MASSILAGFVKGYTDRELDRIDQRRKAEAEEKKLRLLQQLEKETQEWKWQRDPELRSRLESEKQRRELAASAEARAAELHPLAKREAEAGIRAREAQTAASLADVGYRKKATSLLGKTGSGSSLDSTGRVSGAQDVASLILRDYKGLVDKSESMKIGEEDEASSAFSPDYFTVLAEDAAGIAIAEARQQNKDQSWMYNRARDIFRRGASRRLDMIQKRK